MNSSSIPLTAFTKFIYIPLSILTLIACVVAFTGSTIVLVVLFKSRLFHCNVRLLLQNFTTCASLLSLSLMWNAVYNIYLWAFGLVPMSLTACMINKLGGDVNIILVTIFVNSIGIERVITTIWKGRFIDGDRPSKIAYGLVGAAWVSVLVVYVATPMLLLPDNLVRYCFTPMMNKPQTFYGMLAGYALFDIGTIICYVILYRRSRSMYMDFTINTTKYSLAQRHQLINNMETTSLLAPTLLIHSIISVCTVIVAIYTTYHNDDYTLMISVPVFVYALISVDTMLHPILVLSRSAEMRKIALGLFPCMKRFYANPDESAHPNTAAPTRWANQTRDAIVEYRIKQDHINIMNNIWNAKAGRRM